MDILQQRITDLENMYDQLADNPSWVHSEVSLESFGWLLNEIMSLRALLPAEKRAAS
ncbi:hypothetical protein MF628_000956 [Paenibacillus polymyxa]|uniref:hypothetical protein n=1 Tax=Paenibacillus polymyxa TaxID=1406 RepID=UPI0020246B79|nr:hypothetical protein [Paenibacillus polymyxa]URJ46426.1 hypothetical protein MF628_000956 [Paenibacillus polymyxa]